MRLGYPAILPIIIIIILVVLAIGSFAYLNPGFSFYSIYNIGTTPSTPGPVNLSIDKSGYVKGEVLVVFQTGTTLSQVKEIFTKYKIDNYKNVTGNDDSLSSTDIFVAMVAEGLENEIVTRLKGEPMVKSATLNYSGKQ